MGEAEIETETEAEAAATSVQEEGGGRIENHPIEKKSRKEKRKEWKKMKRKQWRKEAAEKEREAEEARLNDPEEQKRIAREEEEERKRSDMALKEFRERERAWIQAMEIKRKAQQDEEEEERRKNDLKEDDNEEQQQQEEMDDDWEYVEEGPAEIIWQGNEITIRKKKIRVPKGEANQKSKAEDADRPTSNPLPPQSEAFSDYLNASSAQLVLESVAKEVPNFGTEQDKAHCPFHLKTGTCRFGQRCSRVHFYPDKSCTLLMRNMYNGPGLALEQDEGLEYTDEEVEQCYEEFYEDVHTEFLKFGEIVNFKVCKNGSFHLRGNVYVQYKSLESAVLAYDSINGRYFAGKQVKCEFVNITRWKVAICGEFMKSRLETCSRGTACNFIHCFRNPGGDYEWADWDKPPPRYWLKKMAALFGYAVEAEFEMQIELENSGHSRNPNRKEKSDDDRHRSRRSKSRERGKNNDRKQSKGLDGRCDRQSTSSKLEQSSERIPDTTSDAGYSDSDIDCTRDTDQIRCHHRAKKRTKWQSDSPEFMADRNRDEDREHLHCQTKKRRRHRSKGEYRDDHGDSRVQTQEDDGDRLDGDRDRDSETHHSRSKSSSHHSKNKTHVADSHVKHLSRVSDGESHHHNRWKSSGNLDEVIGLDDCGNPVECSERSDKKDIKRHRHSRHRYEETDSSEDREVKYHARHRSHGHKRPDEKKRGRDT
ncbi:zinc finger CCCH domain-containing protein 5-like isoform X2 [Hibiscus syriacus]|uniref:zinc finger CCCH domain-containing protein 5-like isoform X2 n=1 Tax=Hibiscus syriacus TaxID=106335 RepID=UPI001920AB18|nr:zinc finger CCCH domain-containing protein 5-like isoform X2 [Hibiscus syriacus]